MESRAGFMALKESQRLERELTGYVDWICRAEDLVLAEDRTTEADREMILEGKLSPLFLSQVTPLNYPVLKVPIVVILCLAAI